MLASQIGERGYMVTNPSVLILIPAFNEENRIESVITRIRNYVPMADILVVNDGSTDGTEAVCRRAGAVVLSHSFNLGVGSALQTGYKYAVREGYEYIIQLDADGQHDPAYLPAFYTTLVNTDADVVIGSRFLANNDNSMTFPRRMGGRIFSLLLSILIKEKITDPTSGFRGMKRRVLDFCVGDLYGFDYPDADFLLTLHRSGFTLVEIPMKVAARISGQSQHRGLKPVYYVLKMFLSIFIILLRKKSV